ncbi:MAG: DUF2842 domain-containing protein [Hyphomicrobiales bacterium]
MNPRLRSFIGTVALITLLVVYFLFILALAAVVLPGRSTAFEFVYWAITGLAWALPAGLIIKWMAKDQPHPPA